MSGKHLTWDRSITLSLIVTILLQTGGALLWVGAAEARIRTLEQHEQYGTSVDVRFARLEEQMQMAQQSLVRIERRLDQSSRQP